MNFLSDIKETGYYKTLEEMPVDSLAFIELSGRRASRTKGKNVIFAVIDTGVSPHEQFEDRLLEGYCTNRDYKTSQWQDDRGHGTHVASSIIGKDVGSSPLGKVLPIKVLDGSGGCRNVLDIIKGIEYAFDWRGPNGERVNVINMSLGGPKKAWGSYFDRLHDVIKKVTKEIPVVCAAGNTGEEDDHYPGSFPEVICVNAVDYDKKIALFSTRGKQVDVCQVGVNVWGAAVGGGYVCLSGTSMASPITSGIAGDIIGDYYLVNKEYPCEPDAYAFLKMNSKDLGIPGTDKIYGAGFACLQPLDVDIKLIIGDPNMYVNNEIYSTDAPPILHNDRFYVPLRWILQLLGGFVNFKNETRTAIFRL